MLAYRRACHGAIPHNGAISSTTTQLLWLLYTQAKSVQSHSGMHCSYLRHPWELQKEVVTHQHGTKSLPPSIRLVS